MYQVYLERRAERDLKKIPADDFHRIISRIKSLRKEPRPTGGRKIVGTRGDWRIRVGEYRIIYEIDEDAKSVRIMRVRRRREVYL